MAMAEIVNLRQFRKKKARVEAAKAADGNRALFGRTRSEKARQRAEKVSATVFVDGHRRDPTDKT